MRLIFKLRFHTAPGDSLWLVGEHELFGGGDLDKAIPLHYVDANFWQVTLVLPRNAVPDAKVGYHYLWRHADGGFSEDWGVARALNPARFQREETLIVDAWNHPGFFENAFYTEPFRRVLLRRPPERIAEAATAAPATSQVHTHTFNLKAPLLRPNETVCLVGNCAALGNWDTTRRLVLLERQPEQDNFFARLDLTDQPFPIQYKYGIYDFEGKRFIRFEDGENRSLADAPLRHREVVVNDGFIVLPANTWKGAGVSIPVFSLRSEQGLGVGEFFDLKRLVDWCRRTGLKLIQLLPINDTIATHTWTDSYPYTAISAFALHPIYLHLPAMAEEKNRKLLESVEAERRRLNALEALDYQAVMTAKLEFLQQIYPRQRDTTFARKDYQEFREKNEEWLVPYAMFCVLRDRYQTPNFNDWPEHRGYDARELAKLAKDDPSVSDEMGFHYFTQFHLHLQLKEVTDYAHAQGVILKGDIPIGVYRHGVDAWQEPDLYHMELQAGAPPDAFAVKGQNWSFPTYNWGRMAETGFAWWKSRLRHMSNYFDAFRIDHILGFFRIWSIPLDAVEGILGYFDPAISVRAEEFGDRGIPFHRERFTQPRITEGLLKKVFGNNWEMARDRFLNVGPGDAFTLKPEFTTQRQVEEHFATLKDQPGNLELKIGLFDLISDVILLEGRDHSGGTFHFRFRIEETSAFQELPAKTQVALKELYRDYFFRRQEQFWRDRGLERLPAIKQVTNMLICGEDLGMVPKCVPEIMKQFGILSLEVQRMPKSSSENFSSPRRAPYLSVVTPSTHDMSTIRGWWQEDREITQKFFNQELGQLGNAPEICEPWIVRAIIGQHLASPAMWGVFQLQDLMGMDEQLRRPDIDAERINVPANPKHYWRYRMHVTLDQLMKTDGFNHELKTCLEQAGRH